MCVARLRRMENLDTGFRLRPSSGESGRPPGGANHAANGERRRPAGLVKIEDGRGAAVARYVRDSFEKNPLGVAAVAVGVGFLVGGGLSTRFGRTLLLAAARVGLRELLRGARVFEREEEGE
jgi:hypothetical protein